MLRRTERGEWTDGFIVFDQDSIKCRNCKFFRSDSTCCCRAPSEHGFPKTLCDDYCGDFVYGWERHSRQILEEESNAPIPGQPPIR